VMRKRCIVSYSTTMAILMQYMAITFNGTVGAAVYDTVHNTVYDAVHMKRY
jgi:hypothetical protein